MVKLKVGVNEITRVLGLVGKCVDVKPLMPIMSNVLFKLDCNQFMAVTSNSEMRIELPITMQVEEGEFSALCVNHAKLSSGVASLPADTDIEMIVEEGSLVVVHETGKFKIPTDDAKDYPVSTPLEEDTYQFECNGSMLIKYLDLAKLCVATDNLRPQLCSVCLDIIDSKLNIASTSGVSMFVEEKEDIDIIRGTENRQLLIPSSSLPAIVSIFNDSELVKVTTDGKRLFIGNSGDILFSVRMVEGAYPPYMSIIPQEVGNEIKINKNMFERILKRASIFSNISTHLVVLTYRSGNLLITGEDIDFSTSINEKLPVLNETTLEEDFRIGCSLIHLGNVLSAIETENVILRFNSPQKAFTLSEDDETSKKLLLIMPMAI